MDSRLIQTLFLDPAVFLLISCMAWLKRTLIIWNFIITDQFVGPSIRYNAGYNRQIEITTTAGMLTQP